MGREIILNEVRNGNVTEIETSAIGMPRERQNGRCSGEKRRQLESCVDRIRSRFGKDSICTATFLDSPPEKRRHDNTKSREYW